MAVFAEIDRAPSFDFNRSVPQTAEEAEYCGRQVPTAAALQRFVFDEKLIPLEGGQSHIPLKKPLTLEIDPETLRFAVKDWRIEMDCAQLSLLSREVARRFLRLLSAAENENLSEPDQADWLRISDYVDFQRFSAERSAPRYMEGTVRSKAEVVIVEWHDGSLEKLDRSVAKALSEVEPAERFSAFVKLGLDDHALLIERVSLLGNRITLPDWQNWPPKS